MELLWAPWRCSYVTKKHRGCFLCAALKAGKDRDRLIVSKTRHSFCILNLYPYNAGHLMIVPRRHVKDLEELNRAERADLMDLFIRMKQVSRKALNAHGFNAGINFGRVAGAGLVGHVHIHLVPRWEGDTNFMPIATDTKVVSASLGALYDCLTKALRK
ncbi:MAG TPA: HIT domain-containing protein [Candidatus Omnitrophota bacterium]|nr:HIT domain-containing protein [Candidatus Omnitrophota bacterium]